MKIELFYEIQIHVQIIEFIQSFTFVIFGVLVKIPILKIFL